MTFRSRCIRCILSFLIINTFPPSTYAHSSQIAKLWNIECIGYYNISVPGGFYYPLFRVPIPVVEGTHNWNNFSEFKYPIGAWNTTIRVDTGSAFSGNKDWDEIYISQEATPKDLTNLMIDTNKSRQTVREEFIRQSNRSLRTTQCGSY